MSHRTQFSPVATTALRYASGSIVVSDNLGDALQAAGIRQAPSLSFRPGTVQVNGEAPALVAEGLDEAVDGRSNPHARRLESLTEEGVRLRIPAADLEDSLGIAGAEIESAPQEVLLLAGDGYIALIEPAALTVDVDVDEWGRTEG